MSAKDDLEAMRDRIAQQTKVLARTEAEHASAETMIGSLDLQLRELGFTGPDFESEINAAQAKLGHAVGLMDQAAAKLELDVQRAYDAARD